MHCLEEVGGQLKGLKIQCSGFDLSDIAVLCPHLRCCVFTKNSPTDNPLALALGFNKFGTTLRDDFKSVEKTEKGSFLSYPILSTENSPFCKIRWQLKLVERKSRITED